MERYLEQPHRPTPKVAIMRLLVLVVCGVVTVACHPIMLHNDSPGCIHVCRLTRPCVRTHAFVLKLFKPASIAAATNADYLGWSESNHRVLMQAEKMKIPLQGKYR